MSVEQTEATVDSPLTNPERQSARLAGTARSALKLLNDTTDAVWLPQQQVAMKLTAASQDKLRQNARKKLFGEEKYGVGDLIDEVELERNKQFHVVKRPNGLVSALGTGIDETDYVKIFTEAWKRGNYEANRVGYMVNNVAGAAKRALMDRVDPYHFPSEFLTADQFDSKVLAGIRSRPSADSGGPSSNTNDQPSGGGGSGLPMIIGDVSRNQRISTETGLVLKTLLLTDDRTAEQKRAAEAIEREKSPLLLTQTKYLPAREDMRAIAQQKLLAGPESKQLPAQVKLIEQQKLISDSRTTVERSGEQNLLSDVRIIPKLLPPPRPVAVREISNSNLEAKRQGLVRATTSIVANSENRRQELVAVGKAAAIEVSNRGAAGRTEKPREADEAAPEQRKRKPLKDYMQR